MKKEPSFVRLFVKSSFIIITCSADMKKRLVMNYIQRRDVNILFHKNREVTVEERFDVSVTLLQQ